MEFIVYVLISMSLGSNMYVTYYTPTTYATELDCENVRERMIEFMKSDPVIGATSICVKIIVSPEEDEYEILNEDHEDGTFTLPEGMAMEKGMI